MAQTRLGPALAGLFSAAARAERSSRDRAGEHAITWCRMTQVQIESAILEAPSDVEIEPGVILPAGRHRAERRQSTLSTLSGRARPPPTYFLEADGARYDVTEFVRHNRWRVTL
jgi:hypothetical protein